MMLIMLQGCKAASSGDFCQLYKPVYTAKADTQETRDAANGNNAVWLELCSTAAASSAATTPAAAAKTQAP